MVLGHKSCTACNCNHAVETTAIMTITDFFCIGVTFQTSSLQEHIRARRLQSSLLVHDIGLLSVVNHGYMAESVHLDHTQRSVLQDIQVLLNVFKITLKF